MKTLLLVLVLPLAVWPRENHIPSLPLENGDNHKLICMKAADIMMIHNMLSINVARTEKLFLNLEN